MLTKRAFLLIAVGLFSGNLALGQTPTPAATGTDMLFWLLGGILGIVLIMVLVTGASLASATLRRSQHQTGPASTSSSTNSQKGVTSC